MNEKQLKKLLENADKKVEWGIQYGNKIYWIGKEKIKKENFNLIKERRIAFYKFFYAKQLEQGKENSPFCLTGFGTRI